MKLGLLLILMVTAVSSCTRRVEHRSASNNVVTAEAINVNTAPVDKLVRLPHVGHKTAEAIIEHRTQNGPFRRVEDLLLVRGISEKRFANIRDHVRVE